MLTKSRVIQLLIMMIVLLSFIFWRTFTVNQDASINDEGTDKIIHLDCDYTQACEFIGEQGSYYLIIDNIPIQAEEWIDFELNVPADNIVISKAKIVGKDMFMGKIPVKFTKTASHQFLAKGMVGSCTTQQMVWLLQVTVVNGKQSETISFDFMVEK